MITEVPVCTQELERPAFAGDSGLNLSPQEDAVLVRLSRPLTPKEQRRLQKIWRGHRRGEDQRPAVIYVDPDWLVVPVVTAPGSIFVTFRLEVGEPLDEALARCVDDV